MSRNRKITQFKKRASAPRNFQCPVCLNTYIAYKRADSQTAIGHIKTMWCPFCQEVRDMVQYKYVPPLSSKAE